MGSIFGFLLFVTLPLVAVAGEVFVRLKSPSGHITPATLRSKDLLYTSSLFARHVFPRTEHVVIGKKGKPKYYINPLGYRGEPFSVQKPPQVVRIMVYGGSAAFDGGAPMGKDWPHLAESRLRNSGFPNVEVINAGIPGLASSDSVGRLLTEGHTFHPDYVLLYAAWNDIKEFQETEPLLRRNLPVCPVNEPKTTYQNFLDYRLCQVSQLYVRLRERYYTRKYDDGTMSRPRVESYGSSLSESALQQYKMNVRTFVDVARNAGAEAVLVSHARLVARDNSAEQKKRILYDFVCLTHEALCDAFEATDRIMREVSAEKNVPLIDASSLLSGREEIFLDHVHFNALGSNAMAEVIATSMASLLGKPDTMLPQTFVEKNINPGRSATRATAEDG
jgi:lysophospholipase L1-like esterase